MWAIVTSAEEEGNVFTFVVYLSVCLSICLSVCLFVCLFVCLSVFLCEQEYSKSCGSTFYSFFTSDSKPTFPQILLIGLRSRTQDYSTVFCFNFSRYLFSSVGTCVRLNCLSLGYCARY